MQSEKISAAIISPDRQFVKKYSQLLKNYNYKVHSIKFVTDIVEITSKNNTDLYLLDNITQDFPVEEFIANLEKKNRIPYLIIVTQNPEIYHNTSLPVFVLNPLIKKIELNSFLSGINKFFLQGNYQKELESMLLHDIRSPLNSLIGYIELLLNNTFGELNEGQYNILEKVMDLGDSTLDMLEDLNELYREMHHVEVPQSQRFDIKKTLDNVLINIWVKADRKNIKIKKEISPQLQYLYGDDYQIQRALTNLISNAIKYSPINSQITIIMNRKKNNYAQITIQDNGGGISESQLPNIFDKYFRLKENNITYSKGYGLGLYICKVIVESHGGKIWAENNTNNGLSIHLTLPLNGIPVRS
jgi:signal transduction histidine kinase